MSHILLRELDIPNIRELDVYLQNGGFDGLKEAVAMSRDEVIQIVKDSGLRGRGGAGFSTGTKWSFIPKDYPTTYVVINADESEPGTFKDRQLLEFNPYQVIEGALICAYAIKAKAVYMYMRGEFWDLAADIDDCLAQAKAKGFIGDNILDSGWSCEFYTHLGAGAYICGEESALLNSLQGLIGQPRVRPPFPAQIGGGLYYAPTVVNNVETLANVPYIMVEGPAAYKQFGTDKSPGVKIYSVSGHVEKPGNYEAPLGITMRELLYDYAGGIPNGKKIKGILPSGASGPVVPGTDQVLDTALTYEAMMDIGTVLGSASVIVMDEDTDMVWAALKMAKFFQHESCGKCTPCREGTYWIKQVMQRLYKGNATLEDIDLLANVASNMTGVTLCALGDFAANPVLATIKHFRSEYEAYVTGGNKPAKKSASAAD